MDMFKRIISVVTVITFIFTLCPVPSALALRPVEVQQTDGVRGIGEDIRSAAKGVEAASTGKTLGILATAAVLLAGGIFGAFKLGQQSTAPQQPATGPDKVQPAQVEIRPSEKMMPYPTTELMRKVQDTARIIRQINGGVFSVMFWDTANVDPDKDFRNIAEFGFNEVIMDGYNYVKGNVDDAAMVEIVLGAHEAGIQSLKFIMGDPSWPYDKRRDAISATTELCEKLTALKRSLQEQGYSEAASIIKGVAMNNEPHGAPQWNFDLGPYCSLHDELEKIADRYGLTYQRVEAFWYTQHNVESGEELRSYRPDDDPFYNMSYRSTASGTCAMAAFSANNEYIIGFDDATHAPTGYKGNPNDLPQQLYDATKTSAAKSPNKYKGTFLHFPKMQDVRYTLNGWRTAVPSQEQVSPATPEREAAPSAQEHPSAPAPEEVSIRVANHQKLDERTTAFEVKVSGLTDAQRSSLVVIALKHTDAYYPQPTVESTFDIPSDGTVRVEIPAREYKGQVLYGEITFCVVKKAEYRKAEFFRSLSEIKGKVAEQGSGVRASLPDLTDTEKMLAFNDMLEAGAQRQVLIATAVEEAPIVTLTPNGLVRLDKKSMMAQVQAGDSKFKEAARLLAQADAKDRLANQYEHGIFGDEADEPVKGQEEIDALRKEAENDRAEARSLRAGVMLAMVQGEQKTVARLITTATMQLMGSQSRYNGLARSADPKIRHNKYDVPNLGRARKELALRKQELALFEERNGRLLASILGLQEIVNIAAAVGTVAAAAPAIGVAQSPEPVEGKGTGEISEGEILRVVDMCGTDFSLSAGAKAAIELYLRGSQLAASVELLSGEQAQTIADSEPRVISVRYAKIILIAARLSAQHGLNALGKSGVESYLEDPEQATFAVQCITMDIGAEEKDAYVILGEAKRLYDESATAPATDMAKGAGERQVASAVDRIGTLKTSLDLITSVDLKNDDQTRLYLSELKTFAEDDSLTQSPKIQTAIAQTMPVLRVIIRQERPPAREAGQRTITAIAQNPNLTQASDIQTAMAWPVSALVDNTSNDDPDVKATAREALTAIGKNADLAQVASIQNALPDEFKLSAAAPAGRLSVDVPEDIREEVEVTAKVVEALRETLPIIIISKSGVRYAESRDQVDYSSDLYFNADVRQLAAEQKALIIADTNNEQEAKDAQQEILDLEGTGLKPENIRIATSLQQVKDAIAEVGEFDFVIRVGDKISYEAELQEVGLPKISMQYDNADQFRLRNLLTDATLASAV